MIVHKNARYNVIKTVKVIESNYIIQITCISVTTEISHCILPTKSVYMKKLNGSGNNSIKSRRYHYTHYHVIPFLGFRYFHKENMDYSDLSCHKTCQDYMQKTNKYINK